MLDLQPPRDPSDPLPPLHIRHPASAPPNKPRTILTWDMTWDMMRHRTPPKVIEELRGILLVDGNFTKFQKRLDELVASPDQEFNIHDLGGDTLMFEAIKLDSTPFITELLQRGIRMNSTYVSEAIRHKAIDTMILFLWNRWDINTPFNECTPPLLGYAASDETMAMWLLDHGADPNQQCSFDITPLSYAAKRGSVHTIKVMLDDYDGDAQKWQLLHYAVRRKIDIVEVLELLIDRGAPINQTMYENHDWSRRFHFWMPLGTALHEAAELGKIKAAHYLLSRGIDASIKNTEGETALDCAGRFNHERVAELLEDVEGNAKDREVSGSSEGQEVPTRDSHYCEVK